jgi:hypothetical protein
MFRVKIAAEEYYWKEFLGLVSYFIEASKKFLIKEYNSKIVKNFENISAHTKSTNFILLSPKQISIS